MTNADGVNVMEEEGKCATVLESEYQAQFFDFTPKAFADTVYNTLSEEYDERIGDLYEEFMSKYSDSNSELVSDCIAIVNREAGHIIEKAVDKLGDYCALRIFSIPLSVTLPEDGLQLVEGDKTAIEEEELDKEIAELERRIKAKTAYNTKLKEELADINDLKRHMVPVMNEMRIQSKYLKEKR